MKLNSFLSLHLANIQSHTSREATVNLKELISERVRNFPPAYLSEMADFLVSMRRKFLEQQSYDLAAISQELYLLDAREQQHPDKEFADFNRQFPKE